MKCKKFIPVLLLLIVSVLLITSCGKNNTNDIVGLWKSSGSESVFYNSIEFFSDGTHITDTVSWSGTYTAERNRLKISGKLYNEVFTFEITDNGNELILTNNLGYSKTYRKAD